MTPEQQARQRIDRRLEQCGWVVQDHAAMDLSAGPGIAAREFPLKTGHADYMLYADAQALGVIEAKPEGHSLTGVEIQSAKYTQGLPEAVPHIHLPLPFAYESTGIETRFTNALEPDFRSREVFTFHRPGELIRLTRLDTQLRGHLRDMPPLERGRLWPIQVEAIGRLEVAIRLAHRPRPAEPNQRRSVVLYFEGFLDGPTVVSTPKPN